MGGPTGYPGGPGPRGPLSAPSNIIPATTFTQLEPDTSWNLVTVPTAATFPATPRSPPSRPPADRRATEGPRAEGGPGRGPSDSRGPGRRLPTSGPVAAPSWPGPPAPPTGPLTGGRLGPEGPPVPGTGPPPAGHANWGHPVVPPVPRSAQRFLMGGGADRQPPRADMAPLTPVGPPVTSPRPDDRGAPCTAPWPSLGPAPPPVAGLAHSTTQWSTAAPAQPTTQPAAADPAQPVSSCPAADQLNALWPSTGGAQPSYYGQEGTARATVGGRSRASGRRRRRSQPSSASSDETARSRSPTRHDRRRRHRRRRRSRSTDGTTQSSSPEADGSTDQDRRDRSRRRMRSRQRDCRALRAFYATGTSSSSPDAPVELGLPPVSRRAARRARRRRTFIPVEDALQAGEAAPRSVCGYAARVAQILAHRCYHFPGAAVQYIIYLAWLLERADTRGLACLRALDVQARTQMAMVPEQYLTAVQLQHFVLSADARSRPSEVHQVRPTRADIRSLAWTQSQICGNFNRGTCQTPCRNGRRHVCGECEAPDHRGPECPRPKNGPPRRRL